MNNPTTPSQNQEVPETPETPETPENPVKPNVKTDAAVFILLGQSNAVGHALPMRNRDMILVPMKNVFGLHRDTNQSYDITELTWSGYTSGGMNLGETQDHTYSVANCLANQWQKAVDEGADLPDLYIIQIAIGAEGVTKGYMWNPDKPQVLVPGKLGTANISLFSFSQHIFSLVDASFEKMGKTYEYVGLHWRGGENDISAIQADPSIDLAAIYTTLIDGFNQTLGNPPIILHDIVAKDRMAEDKTGVKLQIMADSNQMFKDFGNKYPNVTTFDTRNYPGYNPKTRGEGLFQGDMIHFTKEVNQWVAEQILNDYSAIRATQQSK